MNLLHSLPEPNPLSQHISERLCEEFSNRMRPFMKQMGLNYFAMWFLTEDGRYTTLYTDREVADFFHSPKRYHLGALKLRADQFYNFDEFIIFIS